MKELKDDTPIAVAQTTYNPVYVGPSQTGIARVAGHPNQTGTLIDPELAKELSECGFNGAVTVINHYDVYSSIYNCSNHGISLYLENGALRSEDEDKVVSFVNDFKKVIGYGGWFLKNHLTYEDVQKDSIYCRNYNLIRKTDGAHTIFVSLVNENNKNFIPEGKTYKEYISDFQNNFQPSLFSYVMFPIKMNNGVVTVDYKRFYNDLEIFSLMRKYTSAPFWVFCQCMGIRNDLVERPVPTEVQMRFAIFSALGYGAQGVYYYNYRQGVDAAGKEFYTDAPVNENGEKSIMWERVRNVNREIMLYDDIFAGCELIDCRHAGEQYPYTKMFENPMGPLLSLGNRERSMQVSHIFNKGRDYIVMVNPNINYELTIQPEFSDYYNIFYFRKEGDKLNKIQVYHTGITETFVIEPGGCAVFTWE